MAATPLTGKAQVLGGDEILFMRHDIEPNSDQRPGSTSSARPRTPPAMIDIIGQFIAVAAQLQPAAPRHGSSLGKRKTNITNINKVIAATKCRTPRS